MTSTAEVSFEHTDEEDGIISAIADRAVANDGFTDRLSIEMDITACNANGCPLKLQELLDADDFNFAHDVYGISRHMNRETGHLEGFFLPRFAKKEG